VEWLESQVQAINPLLVLAFIPLFAVVIYPALSRLFVLTPLRKILLGFVLAVLAFAITARAQRLIDAEASRFRDEVAALDAAGRIDRAASAAAIRESGLPSLADALENTAATGPVVADKLAAAGIAVTGDGTRLAARWPTVGWQLLAYVVITAAEVLVSITCLEFSYTQAPPHMKSLIMSLYLLSISMGNLFTALVNTVTKDAAGNSTLTGEHYYWFFTGCMALATVLLLPVLASYKPREYLQGGPVAPAE
jgi:dipeptide/tripeptide permease